MTTEKIFNSIFENSLRLLLLLNEYDMPQTLDKLYVVDFLSIYSAEFGISDRNLNGKNHFMFSEFAAQREVVKKALCELVLNGTAEAVRYKNGLSYIITPEGEDYCLALVSDYANEYRMIAHKVIEATNEKSERELIAKICELSDRALRKETIL